MKKHIYIASLLALGVSLNSCDDLFEPALENTQSIEQFEGAPLSAHGILLTSYAKLGFPNLPESDYATDDCVTNDLSSNWSKIATGAWSADNNPTSRWSDYYYAIQNLNLFIENVGNFKWYEDPVKQALQIDHFQGEAYALRGIFMYYLLQAHAGYVGGNLSGVLIHTESESGSSDFNQSRASYKECYEAMLADFDEALLRLPDQYLDDWTDANIPQRLKEMGANGGSMARINGAQYCTGKLDGRITKAFRALAALTAASDAFQSESWENAANYALDVVNQMGGVSGINKHSIDWFTDNTYVTNLANNTVPDFTIWWVGKTETKDWEADNFPESMNGKGRTNPSQNLVDAFPMANGYPITDSKSGYNPKDPYKNRDPRLDLYILRNGGQFGTNATITTAEYATNKDGIDKDPQVSTRTGYYMKKFLVPTVNASSTAEKKEYHIQTRIRSLEIYLAYAEAANEAWGPTSGSPSAYEIIKQIRKVSGIDEADPYLESIKSDKEKMREMIRNERRLCLCFENKRFWDLRRWKADLNEPVKGMRISGSASNPVYEVIEVESRNYQDYMYYGPLPISDVNKFSNLRQNDGWN